MNGRKEISVRVNAISADHAEIEPLSQACGKNMGVVSVARQFGLKKLIFRDPSGSTEYVIEY
jgi:hypothetical protein